MDSLSYIGYLTEKVSHARNQKVPDDALPEFVAMCLYEQYAEVEDLVGDAMEPDALLRMLYNWTLDFIQLYGSICGLYISSESVLRGLALMLDEDVVSLSVRLYLMEREL